MRNKRVDDEQPAIKAATGIDRATGTVPRLFRCSILSTLNSSTNVLTPMQIPSSSMLGTPLWPASSASLIRYGFSRRCVAWKEPPGSPCASSTASEPALPAGLHHRALTLSPRRRRRRRRHASTSPRAQVPRPHLILSSDAVRGESREPAERGLLDASEARAGTRAPTVSVAVPRSRSGPGPNGSLSVSRRPGSGSWQAPA